MHLWRAMRPDDLPAVNRIANQVHPNFPESDAIPAERLALYPAGCLVLEINGEVTGYAVSHPWRDGKSPALDHLLGRLPDHPDTLYLHDLALLPTARGTGAATQAVGLLAALAAREGLPTMILVAVNNSTGFWQRQGFRVTGPAPVSYGADARVMTREIVIDQS
jgi:ribosomal protein S18 acetylase RimI-like enzyme